MWIFKYSKGGKMNEPEILMFRGKPYWGYKTCPAWLKMRYRDAVNHICQDCKKDEKKVGKLEPHRIIRGVEGGLYTVLSLNHPKSNVKIVCKACHKRYNYSRKLNYQYSI